MKFKIKSDKKKDDVVEFYLKAQIDGTIQIRAKEDSSGTKQEWSIGWLTPTGLKMDSGILSSSKLPLTKGRFTIRGYSRDSRY